jgi:tetratricopeptide (TPR) repeat protein
MTAGKPLICAILSALLLVTSVFAQQATKEPSTIVQAEAAMDQQQWPEAEVILRKLVSSNAKNSRAWFDLGYVMHAQRNYPEAIAAYRSAVAAAPESFECNLNLGMMLAHEGDTAAAQVLEKATRLKPTSAHPSESLARAWAALAQVESSAPQAALAAWAHAVQLSSDPQLHLGYGEAFEKSGDLAAAEREFRSVADAEPPSPDALAALANLYMHAQRFPEAESTLRRLVSAAPQDESAHLQFGRVLSVLKKDAEASAELQKALALKPDDSDALRELAFVEERARQWPAAERDYRTLVARFPNDADLHNGLGAVLLPQLKYAEARDEFLLSVKLKPQWGEAYGQLALAASGNKEYELAIKSLDARKKLLPELPSSYFLRATCYDHLRMYAEAVENYKAFLAASKGQFPDEEWKARHRLIAIEPEARKKK